MQVSRGKGRGARQKLWLWQSLGTPAGANQRAKSSAEGQAAGLGQGASGSLPSGKRSIHCAFESKASHPRCLGKRRT